MTESGPDPAAGTTLLKIARRLLSEATVVAVIEPTLADFQRELATAGTGRRDRLRARARGYRAFWTVMLMAAFAPWTLPTNAADANGLPEAIHVLAGLGILGGVLVLNPAIGAVALAVIAAGGLCALAMHVWYQRHPSELPTPTQRIWRPPQINFSSTDVAGNSGGLIFVVGTIVVLTLGLPAVLCFLIAGTLAGCLVARALVEWRSRHPSADRPEHHIVCR